MEEKDISYYIKRLSIRKVFSAIREPLINLRDILAEKKIQLKFNKVYKKHIIPAKGIQENTPRKLILTLTSYPKRFNKLHLVLYPLLTQTLKPNKVILVLSEKEVKDESELPDKILFLKRLGLQIKFIKENYRPYNKFIFTLKDFPDYNIITVDDDILYPKWFLEKMYLKHKYYPKDILCYRAHLIKKSNNQLKPYSEWENYPLREFASGMNLFPTGVSGTFYPPNSLNKEVFNSKVFLKISAIQDDVWCKAMSLLNNTNCRRVFINKNLLFPILKDTQATGLYHQNVELNKNDEQIENVFKKYNLNKYLENIS